jgi:uncharacterized protein YbjT (DUF2867 family)
MVEHAGRVACLSTDVAEPADGDCPASVHQEIERLIRASGLRRTFLRAIDFATNTLAWTEQIDAPCGSHMGRPPGR